MRGTLISEVLGMDDDDLNRLVEVVKSRRAQLAEVQKLRFGIGDRVQFQSRKRGFVKGTVLRIMRKNVKVKQDNGPIWTVYPGFLQEEVK